MIEWIRRVDPNRPFLRHEGGVWTYGDTLAEVERRAGPGPRVSQPDLRPSAVFDLLAGLSSGGVTVVGPQPELTRPVDADLVVFTSGTTGPPKGVRLTRANLAAAAAASAEHLGHGPEDDWLLAMPLHHVGGLSILVRQMFTGGSVTMLPGFDVARFAEAMHGGVTMVSVVPTMLRRVVEHGPFRGLRAVLVGGGPIPGGLLEEAVESGLPVLPTYGMTETFGQAATLRPGAPPIEPRAHPLPGVELRIEPDGRIAVKGAQVSPGYVDEQDRPDPWFVTNDLGDLDAEGAVRVLGRADMVIITGGEKVSPEAVEAAIRRHPDVTDIVVVGAPDAEWGETVVAFYEGSAESGELASWCANRLPGFMVPRRWVRMRALPRVDLGKPDRAAMRILASS